MLGFIVACHRCGASLRADSVMILPRGRSQCPPTKPCGSTQTIDNHRIKWPFSASNIVDSIDPYQYDGTIASSESSSIQSNQISTQGNARLKNMKAKNYSARNGNISLDHFEGNLDVITDGSFSSKQGHYTGHVVANHIQSTDDTGAMLSMKGKTMNATRGSFGESVLQIDRSEFIQTHLNGVSLYGTDTKMIDANINRSDVDVTNSATIQSGRITGSSIQSEHINAQRTIFNSSQVGRELQGNVNLDGCNTSRSYITGHDIKTTNSSTMESTIRGHNVSAIGGAGYKETYIADGMLSIREGNHPGLVAVQQGQIGQTTLVNNHLEDARVTSTAAITNHNNEVKGVLMESEGKIDSRNIGGENLSLDAPSAPLTDIHVRGLSVTKKDNDQMDDALYNRNGIVVEGSLHWKTDENVTLGQKGQSTPLSLDKNIAIETNGRLNIDQSIEGRDLHLTSRDELVVVHKIITMGDASVSSQAANVVINGGSVQSARNLHMEGVHVVAQNAIVTAAENLDIDATENITTLDSHVLALGKLDARAEGVVHSTSTHWTGAHSASLTGEKGVHLLHKETNGIVKITTVAGGSGDQHTITTVNRDGLPEVRQINVGVNIRSGGDIHTTSVNIASTSSNVIQAKGKVNLGSSIYQWVSSKTSGWAFNEKTTTTTHTQVTPTALQASDMNFIQGTDPTFTATSLRSQNGTHVHATSGDIHLLSQAGGTHSTVKKSRLGGLNRSNKKTNHEENYSVSIHDEEDDALMGIIAHDGNVHGNNANLYSANDIIIKGKHVSFEKTPTHHSMDHKTKGLSIHSKTLDTIMDPSQSATAQALGEVRDATGGLGKAFALGTNFTQLSGTVDDAYNFLNGNKKDVLQLLNPTVQVTLAQTHVHTQHEENVSSWIVAEGQLKVIASEGATFQSGIYTDHLDLSEAKDPKFIGTTLHGSGSSTSKSVTADVSLGGIQGGSYSQSKASYEEETTINQRTIAGSVNFGEGQSVTVQNANLTFGSAMGRVKQWIIGSRVDRYHAQSESQSASTDAAVSFGSGEHDQTTINPSSVEIADTSELRVEKAIIQPGAQLITPDDQFVDTIEMGGPIHLHNRSHNTSITVRGADGGFKLKHQELEENSMSRAHAGQQEVNLIEMIGRKKTTIVGGGSVLALESMITPGQERESLDVIPKQLYRDTVAVSEIAYQGPKERPNKLESGMVYDQSSSTDRVAVYVDEKNKKVFAGVRGSTTWADWTWRDLNIFFRGYSNRDELKHVIEKVQQKYSGMELTLTGHSLGGEQATSMGSMLGLQVVTFNAGAGPLNTLESSKIKKHDGHHQQYHIRNDRDIVSAFLNKTGPKGENVHHIDVTGPGTSHHSMSQFKSYVQ
ncbi:hypothetical protein PROFUN_13344 [Planoprotostelium fungivorum]|uniref:Uncharacterized protein n=1 Tax=Planoprotostelium fungivorum TaxID=1890364 RepID=A0A2P6N4M6_9EUKA|nr:hypothetical protein PROFUN_13344 [Planoprotostelium fungivorum]